MDKKTKGRQKTKMKLIENECNRQVTFTKRRNGLIKKASELCVLCGAKVAVIAFSGAGKLYTFGEPDIKAVIDSYQNGLNYVPGGDKPRPEVDEYNKLQSEKLKVKEELMKKKAEVTAAANNKKMAMQMNGGEGGEGFWWDEPVDEKLGEQEVQQHLLALEKLRENVVNRLNEIRLGQQYLNGGITGSPIPILPNVDRHFHMPQQLMQLPPSNVFGSGLGLSHPFGINHAW